MIARALAALLCLGPAACASAGAGGGATAKVAVEAVGVVDRSCQVDADCAVKDVGNCCGYYPACVNQHSPTFAEQVKAACAREGRMAICGFPSISGCRCVAGSCQDITGPNADGVHSQ